MKRLNLLLLALNFAAFSSHCSAAEIELSRGEAILLHLPEGSQSSATVTFRSSDSHVVQAFANGYCFGIAPGETLVNATAKGDRHVLQTWKIHVSKPDTALKKAVEFQQFPGNKKFRGRDGRECYGCELNCRQAESSGTKSNRVVNPNPIPGARVVFWPVDADTVLVDGAGTPIGKIVRESSIPGKPYASKFNHGMTKILNGEVHVYSFATPVRLVSGSNSGKTVGLSAWMPLQKVRDCETLLERLHPGSGHLPRVELEGKGIEITGGRPADYNTTAGYPLRIVKQVNTPPKPHDYLIRDAGTINLLYAVPGFGLGGHSLDSFLISNHPVFYRAKGINPITVPTYYPPEDDRAGRVSPETMTFLFGGVKVHDADPVYGWIAAEALKQHGGN
jgi:hypothetical protein